MSTDLEGKVVCNPVRRLLADRENGPALSDGLKGGLSAVPIGMQNILCGPLFKEAEGDQR